MAAPALGPAGSRTTWPELVDWAVPEAILHIMKERRDIQAFRLIDGDDLEPPQDDDFDGSVVRLLVNYYRDQYFVKLVKGPPAPPPRIG